MKVLITGASGFVGKNLVPYLHERHWDVITLDALPAPVGLSGFENHIQYRLGSYGELSAKSSDVLSGVRVVIHLASQSHVDRSIDGPVPFIDDNVRGTLELFEFCRKLDLEKIIHFSTDEVGACLQEGSFKEDYVFECGSVYSASKGAQELLVQAYIKTYDLPIVTTRCVNIFGPHQATEKLIPKTISSALGGLPVPVYGDGMQKRQWVHVDHVCEYVTAVAAGNYIPPKTVLHITGTREIHNVMLVQSILGLLGKPSELIKFVPDRLGHDVRYALGRTDKTNDFIDLEYKESSFFEDLKKTVNWYREAL